MFCQCTLLNESSKLFIEGDIGLGVFYAHSAEIKGAFLDLK